MTMAGDSLLLEQIHRIAFGKGDDRFLEARDGAFVLAASRLLFRALIHDVDAEDLGAIETLEGFLNLDLVGASGHLDGDFVGVLELSHALLGDARI